MSILEKKPRKNEKYPYRIIDGQALIIDPNTNIIKLLNEVGTKIWELIDGKKTGAEILNKIIAEYDVSPEVARNDLIKFCQELMTIGFIEVNND